MGEFNTKIKIDKFNPLFHNSSQPHPTSAKASLARAIRQGEDIEVIVDLKDTVEDLKERINFAWQDEEE